MLAQPVVSNRRMVNAANFAPQGLPNGSLARGAFFTISGSSFSPSASAGITYPLPTTLEVLKSSHFD